MAYQAAAPPIYGYRRGTKTVGLEVELKLNIPLFSEETNQPAGLAIGGAGGVFAGAKVRHAFAGCGRGGTVVFFFASCHQTRSSQRTAAPIALGEVQTVSERPLWGICAALCAFATAAFGDRDDGLRPGVTSLAAPCVSEQNGRMKESG